MTVAVATALGSVSGIQGLAAQEVSAADSERDVIVVTASRRENVIQEAPYSIHAISGEALADQRITSLTELSRHVPGLTVVDQGTRGADLIVYRGLHAQALDASDYLDNSSGGSVQTYLGEIPLYLDWKMVDLERVEALPGPQGTLYGAGTLAGAIRYIPNAPDLNEFSLSVHADVYSLSHSDDPGFESDAVINVPLIEDKLAFRGSFYDLDDPGYIDYPYVVRNPGVSDPEPDLTDPVAVNQNLVRMKDVNTEDISAIRLALLYAPTDAVQATFNYYNQSKKTGGRSVNHQRSFGTGPYESAHRFIEPEDRESSLFSIEVVADLGFAELTSATGLSEFDHLGQRDQTDVYLSYPGWGYQNFPQFVSYSREDFNEERLNQEFRLVSKSSGRIGWIAGAFFNEFDIDTVSEEFVPGYADYYGVPELGISSYLLVKSDTLKEQALFGEISYALSDRLEVTAGTRMFSYDTRQYYSSGLPLFDIEQVENVNGDDSGVLGKLSVSYMFSDALIGYATLSEGYRIGGANPVTPCPQPLPEDYPSACTAPDEILIKPDETLNLEFGSRLQLAGGMQIDAAVYTIDWDNLQLLSETDYGASIITVNGSSARSTGLELGLRKSFGQWSLASNYSYTDARLTADAPRLFGGLDAGDGADALDGDRLPGTAEHQFSAAVDYRTQLQNGWTLDFAYGLAATSDVLTKAGLRSGGERLGGYTTHNAAVSLGTGAWVITLYADNLTDKFAETASRADPSAINTVLPSDPGDTWSFESRRYYRNVIRPRTIGLEFRYSMGE